jgi:Lrp/AsnC family transcriptional regulator, regulator for asnA, asnC and gidA
MDPLDRRILDWLREDARTPYLEVARLCQVSGATVHLRIQKLKKVGTIEGSYLALNYQKLA